MVSVTYLFTSFLVTNYGSGYVRLILLIPSMLMNPLFESTKQIQCNKTTSILVAVHTWRVLGLAFLWGVSQGILPPAFGIPAGVGDVMIGVTAIPFAYFLRRGYSWSKYALIIWSVLGIADLVNAVSMGLITAPVFPGSTMTTFPWILVPTLGVPLALLLHGITIRPAIAVDNKCDDLRF